MTQSGRVEVWFDEEDDAAAFAEAVGADPRPVWFAGEEDGEDAAWVVLVDELDQDALDEHHGWVPDHEPPAAVPAPLDLPSAPKRIKNPARP